MNLSEIESLEERYRRIIWSVVRNARWFRRDYGGVVLWSVIADLCGLGSTSAIELCEEFSVDPHQMTFDPQKDGEGERSWV